MYFCLPFIIQELSTMLQYFKYTINWRLWPIRIACVSKVRVYLSGNHFIENIIGEFWGPTIWQSFSVELFLSESTCDILMRANYWPYFDRFHIHNRRNICFRKRSYYGSLMSLPNRLFYQTWPKCSWYTDRNLQGL